MENLKTKLRNYAWLVYVVSILALVGSVYLSITTKNITQLAFIVLAILSVIGISTGVYLHVQYLKKKRFLQFVEPELKHIQKFYFIYNEATLLNDEARLDELFLLADDRTTPTATIGIRCAEALDKINYPSDILFEHWLDYPGEFVKFIKSVDHILWEIKKPFKKCPVTLFNIKM